MKSRRLATLALLALASSAALVATAAPAQAATVTVASAVGSPVSAFAVATCPAGLTLVGAGGEIVGGTGNVVLTDVIPNVAAGTVTAWGHEKGAFGGAWSVAAVAICEPVAGVVQVAVASPVNGAAVKTVGPACPAGTLVTGVGYQLINGNGEVFPQIVRPGAALGGAVVSATENGAYAPAWQLIGYALCAPSAGFAPLRLMAVNGPSSVSKSVTTLACPFGTIAYGVGGEIVPTAGGVILDQIVPDLVQTTATSRGSEFAGFGGMWTIISYVVCW